MKRSERLKRDIRHYSGISLALFLWSIMAGCGAIATNEDGGEILHGAAICIALTLIIFSLRNLSEAIRHARLLALWNSYPPAGTGEPSPTRDAG